MKKFLENPLTTTHNRAMRCLAKKFENMPQEKTAKKTGALKAPA